MKKNDEGFTLIELLIVIVILGILATVVVFAVGGITDRGQQNACQTDARTLRTAAETYLAQEGDYPADMDAMVTEYLSSASTYHTYTYTGPVDPATIGTYTIESADLTKCPDPTPEDDG